MTAKRFYIDEESDIIEFDWDNSEYIQDFMYTDGKDWEKLCNRLNELYEENQDLKSFNKDLAEELSVCANARISKDNRIEKLEEKIQRERTSFTKTHERWSKEAENKIKELSEENEQLKKDIEYYKIERLALFEYLDKKDDLKLELKVEK